MRVSVLSAAVAALVALPGAGGARAAADEDPTLARVVAALEKVEARAASLERSVEAARLRTDAAPPSLARTVAELQARRASLVPLLLGRQWTEVRPVVERAERLGARLSGIGRLLADWPARASRHRVARAPAGTAAILGRLRDAQTGAPIPYEWIVVRDSDGDYILGTSTDSSGQYDAAGLASGTYFVTTDTDDHMDELYHDIPCEPACSVAGGTPIPLADGQARTGVDFDLMPLGAIEGTVLDAAENPIQYASVIIYDAEGDRESEARSGADGRYRAARLRPGLYFAVARSEYHLDELYAGIPCQPDCEPQAGDAILVGIAATVTGIDFDLDLAGSVSGRVTEQASGQPVVNTSVQVYDSVGDSAGYAYTDATGAYRVFDLVAGTYFARTGYSLGYLDELWDDIPCDPNCTPTSGAPIMVAQGQERAGIDFALHRFGSISGRVTDADQGLPLEGVAVRAVNAQGGFVSWTETDASGRYHSGGLRAGPHFVFTASPLHLDELYDDLPCEPTCTPTTGTPIAVALDVEAPGIDFALRRGGWIAGRVAAQSTGAPLDEASVAVYRQDGSYVQTEYSDGSGLFTVAGLVPGTYYAKASSSRYLAELFRERPCPQSGCNPVSGDPITVAVAQGTSGIDFTLARLGRVFGQVKDGSGLPISTSVRLFNAAGDPVGYASTSDSGAYAFDGLQAGSYFAATLTTTELNVVDELYDDIPCEPTCNVTTGTPVVVALDATTAGIDFTLRRSVFADVPVSHFAWKAVEAVYAAGITSGCATSPLRFCPDVNVTRAQMAVFLLTAKEGPGYVPPPAQGIFGDVPASDPFARWIEELANRGIASGCSANPPLYCPGAATTRAQMAPLLLVTREGTGYFPPNAVGVFQDVPATDPFARWIEELVRRRVTSGCSLSPPLYCPGQATSRAQMAVFLASAFALP